MKLALTIPVVAAMLATSGCTNLYSTDPIVSDNEAITVPGLAGVWTKDGDTILIREKGSAYAITYRDDKSALVFTGRVVRAGKELLLDVVREADEPFLLPLHFAVRARLDGATLSWSLVGREEKKKSEQILLSREDLRKAADSETGSAHQEVWTRAND